MKSQKEKKEWNTIFEDRIFEKLLKLIKDRNPQVQEAHEFNV